MLSFNIKCFWFTLVAIFFFEVAKAGEDTLVTNTTINDNTGNQQTLNANNLTLINNATIEDTETSISVRSADNLSGVTVINNVGGVIKQGGSFNSTLKAERNTNFTLINSGTISAGESNGGQAISIKLTVDAVITNNAGGIITTNKNAIRCTFSCTNPTINNSGTITARKEGVIRLDKSTGMVVNNNVGGVIHGEGTEQLHIVQIGTNGTLTNSGTIKRIFDGAPSLATGSTAIIYQGDNGTVLLKDEGIVVGTIRSNDLVTGSKLQIDHGYGRSYMYHTLGELELADLSGNRIVKGSATAVGMGAQETVDELLGLRAYNLRATLKRYADAPHSKAQIEPFAYVSHRDRGRTTLRYDNYAAGTSFIYPVVPDKLNLILTLERNKLRLDEGHDVTKNSFLIGVNTNNFMELAEWKASGFVAGGWSWHDSSRDVLTNTVLTGIADVSADYESAEAITGISFSHTYDQKANELISNTWETDLGLTFSFSHTPSYSESQFFTWEERNLTQLSIHIGEQLTSMLGDKVQFRLGGEFEHRSVIAGKNQDHALNAVTVDFNSGTFYENSISMNTGFDYALGDHSKAYIQFNGRVSDQTAYSLGASAGVELVF